MQGKDVPFFTWVYFTMPFCLVMLFGTWLCLLVFWKPTLKGLPKIEAVDYGPMTWSHYYTAFVTLATVTLWCTFQFTQSFFGSLGLIGLVPVISLYAPGILGTEDFKRLDWNILMLLGGGASLGDAVKSSGLLQTLASHISGLFGTVGLSAGTCPFPLRHLPFPTKSLAFATSKRWLYANIDSTHMSVAVQGLTAAVRRCPLG